MHELLVQGELPNIRKHFVEGGVGVENAQIPSDAELPLLLDKLRPLHEVVRIDHHLPGCPPSADAFWHFLTELIAGRDPSLPLQLLRYD